ncbi:MAG: hypothetical protein LBL36_00675 [Clostridiales Family XIII bacterium]|jgi:hypothetical protein|nr:hypothetical protein [Clostridiales Family XIII bacterium]
MGKRTVRIGILRLVVLALVLALLSGCTVARNVISTVTQPKPTAETTLTSMGEINDEVEEALRNGEKSVRLDVTQGEEQIADMTRTLSPFWGAPTEYRIVKRFSDIELNGVAADVMRIDFTLTQSDNYYVYKAYTDKSYAIPPEQTRAAELLAALPGILAEIDKLAEKHAGNATYVASLAVHDWLAKELTYDDSLDQLSYRNGIYGALIERRTMCLGYAEAMKLILLCKGETSVSMVVGDADTGGGQWISHVWNLVNVGGAWMHIDATFDDPKDNAPGEVSHIYFGQDDAFMRKDHRWEAADYPAATQESYSYFKTNGLYISEKKKLRKVLRSYIAKNKPAELEIAVTGFTLRDSDLQFIYSIDDTLSQIYCSFVERGDTTIARLTLKYD